MPVFGQNKYCGIRTNCGIPKPTISYKIILRVGNGVKNVRPLKIPVVTN